MIAIIVETVSPIISIFPHQVASSAQKNKPLMKQSLMIRQVHTLFSYIRMCQTAIRRCQIPNS